MPYRQPDVDERPPEGEQEGIVGDLVRQFADPYAFFRELVQNAIDAGTASIRVDIARDSDGALLFSVTDAGEGMDRDILEKKLLVLFRSGKEGVAGKIGKFGIGFVSVLALNPSVVKVRSTRGGKGHTLHLYADHAYELFEHNPGAPGTVVTIVVPVPKAKAEVRVKEHVERSRASLRRWCEHAQVPIALRVDESAFGQGILERIDREMQLDDTLCSVRIASSDGQAIVLVGLLGSEGQRAAFYNRGLLLTETEEPLGFPGLMVKVQSSELEHTLSRDNVRRDRGFSRALEDVAQVVDTGLRRAVHDALRAATRTSAEYHTIASAVAHTSLDPTGLPLRLLHPRDASQSDASPGGKAVGVQAYVPTAAGRGPLRGARVASGLTALLAARGDVVVDLEAIPDAYLRRLHRRGVRVDETWSEALSAVALTPAEPGSSDARLLARVAQALSAAYRDPRDVQLGLIHGKHVDSLCIGQLDAHGQPMNPFALLPFRRVPLILNVEHPLVDAARRHAVSAPDFAADLLTRGVLRVHDALTPARSELLLADTLRELLPDAADAKGSP